MGQVPGESLLLRYCRQAYMSNKFSHKTRMTESASSGRWSGQITTKYQWYLSGSPMVFTDDQTVHHPWSHPEQAHQAPYHDPPPQLWEQMSEY